MKFDIESFALSEGDGEQNEDIAGASSRLAWIIDGATDVPGTWRLPNETGAHWIAHEIHDFFSSQPSFLSNPITDAALHVRDRLGDLRLNELVPPACSCATMQLEEDGFLRISMVGDIYIFVDGVKTLVENQVFGRNEELAVARQGGRARGMRLADQSTTDAILERRISYIEGRHGSWILSNNPHVGQGIVKKNIRVSDGTRILLATDGFARLVSPYRLYDSWQSLLESAMRSGLQSMLKELRDFERSNVTDNKNFKARDDACGILLSVGHLKE